jgi:hypothetical protein
MEQRSGFIAVNVGSLFLSFTTPWINPRILVGSVLFIFFSLRLVPCCDVRYDFYIKTMFGSSLSPVVCRRVHILFTFYLFACVFCCCCCLFCFCFSSFLLPVSLYFRFWIAPSVFSNVYLNMYIYILCVSFNHPLYLNFLLEEFEDIKGVVRIRISKKNRQHSGHKIKYRQHSGHKIKYKRTNHDLQNIHIKLKIE